MAAAHDSANPETTAPQVVLLVLGPCQVLARLAAASGDDDAARRHADEGSRLASELGAPVFERETEEALLHRS